MSTTATGNELALQLAPVIGTTHAIQETCAAISRKAKSHHRLQEQLCNGFQTYSGDWDEQATERAEQRDERLEAQITALVESLPEWEEDDGDRGRFGVLFGGDPRGCTVKLTGPRSIYDSWGGDGVCVPVGR